VAVEHSLPKTRRLEIGDGLWQHLSLLSRLPGALTQNGLQATGPPHSLS